MFKLKPKKVGADKKSSLTVQPVQDASRHSKSSTKDKGDKKSKIGALANFFNIQKTGNTAKIKHTEETSLKSLIKVLVIYSNLDKITEDKVTPMSAKKRAQNLMKTFIKTFDEMSNFNFQAKEEKLENIDVSQELKKVNKDILFFLLNVTTEEFHHFFMDFYSLFDPEKDYLLSKDNFEFIVNYMGSPENMGKEKLNLSLKLILSKGNVLKGALDKLGRFFVTQGNEVVAPDILNDLFEELKDENMSIDKGHERQYFIDFLKFLPILMSYFLEYMKRRIELRRENFMMIKGVRDDLVDEELELDFFEEENKGSREEVKSPMRESPKSPLNALASFAEARRQRDDKKNNISLIKNTTSLLYRFESCGFNYKNQKNTKILSYRDIEKILILFRNSYNASMSEEQIEIILKEAQKLMKVDSYSKVEFKRKKFKTILHWMAYKIGLHCCCYDLSKKMISSPMAFLEEHVLWTCAAYSDKLDEESLKERFENFKDKHLGTTYSNSVECLEAFLRKIIPNLTSGEFKHILKNFRLAEDEPSTILTENIYNSVIYKKKKFLHESLCEFFFVPADANSVHVTRNSLRKSPVNQNNNFFQFPSQEMTPQPKSPRKSVIKNDDFSGREEPKKKEEEVSLQINSFNEEEPKEGSSINNKDLIGNFKNKYDKQPDILKSCFIMEQFILAQNFLEKYVYLNKHRLKYQENENEDEKADEEAEQDDDSKSKETLNKSMNRSYSRQKSIGSQVLVASQMVNPQELEKKNARTKSSKHLKNDKSDQTESRVPSLSLIKTYRNEADDEREKMKSAFLKYEIDEADEKFVESPERNKVRKNQPSLENKMLMRNEFSNNVKSEWFLSEELKEALKKQEKHAKKKRCSCKMFKIDKKACQCRIF